MEDVRVTTFPIKWDNASEEALEGGANAVESPIKEYSDGTEVPSQTNGLVQQEPANTDSSLKPELAAKVQQGWFVNYFSIPV